MTVNPNANAYEVAVEFIHLGNILRAWHSAGIEPSLSFLQEMCDCRFHLDRVLHRNDGDNWSQWTVVDAWADAVRGTPTANSPATTARV